MLPLSRPAMRPTAASRSSRPGRSALRRACAVAAVALIPVLAGCEAGSNAPVLHWHPSTNGASATIKEGGGEIAIRNAFILGAPPNATLPGRQFGQHVRGAGQHGAAGPPGQRSPRRALPPRSRCPRAVSCWRQYQSALLTGPAPKLILTGLTRSLASGTYVKVFLTFQNAGTVGLDLPVLARADSYATFSPAPGAADAQRDREGQAGAGQRVGDPTPTASGFATATPTPTATPDRLRPTPVTAACRGAPGSRTQLPGSNL